MRPKNRFNYFLIAVYLFSFATIVIADDESSKLIEYLAQEKNNLAIAVHPESNNAEEPKNQQELSKRIEQNQIKLALIAAKINNFENFLNNQRKQQQNLTSLLKKLQASPVNENDTIEIQERIVKINSLLEVNAKAIDLINDNLNQAKNYQVNLLNESRRLNLWQAKIDERVKEEDLNRQINVLNAMRDRLYQRNMDLQNSSKISTQFSSIQHAGKLLLNEQEIILIQYQINELELQKKLMNSEYLLFKNEDIRTLQTVTDTFKFALTQLSSIEDSLNKMEDLLKQEKILAKDPELQQNFLTLQKNANFRLQHIISLKKEVASKYEEKLQGLKSQLAQRQNFAQYHLESWTAVTTQIAAIPNQFYHYLSALFFKVKENYIWLDFFSKIIVWISAGFCLLLGSILYPLLRKVIKSKERSRLSAHLYDGLLLLVYQNIPHLVLLSILLCIFFFTNVPFANYQLAVNLIVIWLIFRNLILIARLILLESTNESSGEDVKLYFRLKWLFMIGGWVTALMVVSFLLPLQLVLQDIFNRLFMLFILALSVVIWKSREDIPILIRPFLRTKKRYFRNAISLLFFLIPLILLTTAIIGLIGYINLAWSLSRYQAYLLLLIIGYILVRGLIIDVLELLSEFMISQLDNGWLWIEVILKPLDKILRFALFVISIIILFQLLGWYSNDALRENLQNLIAYPLIDVSGIHITLMSMGEFFIGLCILIWIATWTREFCYRWVYRNTKDAGIRNSLAVFTQYAIVLMGAFIILRILGFDFSGMSMVLGGLAVGMGFGLRDFASNIIGGVMLLIERPVREGDLITIGEHEGRVAHIGIRSMRVSSWDNMEILIPNAETFNKPFANWTHQDSIVRTVLPVKVSREDDPARVQQLIADVLTIIPEILDEPKSQVLLSKIDEALMEFEIRYFINVQTHSRAEVRSKVLFAISAQFKAAGIKAPIPPMNVEITNLENKKLLDETLKPAED